MCDRVLTADDIHSNLLHYHHFQRRPNGWVQPCPITLTSGSHVHYPPHRLVVKPLKGFLQPGGYNPYLGHKQKHRMHHHHIKHPNRSPIRSLSSKYLHQTSPFYLRPTEVPLHHWPVVFGRRQCLYQVLERRDRPQMCPIFQEDSPHPFLHILNNQPLSLPFCPAPAHLWSTVRPIEWLLWDKHVASMWKWNHQSDS